PSSAIHSPPSIPSRSPSRSSFFRSSPAHPRHLPSFPTRRSSDLLRVERSDRLICKEKCWLLNQRSSDGHSLVLERWFNSQHFSRSEEHTSELQSLTNLVCRLLLEKKKPNTQHATPTHRPHLSRNP